MQICINVEIAIEAMPQTHPDYEELTDAKSKIEQLTDDINEGKRYYIALQQLMHIHSLIQGYEVCDRCVVHTYQRI